MVHKIIDGIPVPADLRADFPNTSFPSDLSIAVLPGGYVWVAPIAPPTRGQFERVEAAPPAMVDGVWMQQWQIVPWTPEEVQAWRNGLECGPYQMALALNRLGLFETVEAMVAQAGGMTEFAWKRATVFRRMDPMIEAMRVALGKTAEEVDGLFLLAQTL